jgi:hypothetical protein
MSSSWSSAGPPSSRPTPASNSKCLRLVPQITRKTPACLLWREFQGAFKASDVQIAAEAGLLGGGIHVERHMWSNVGLAPPSDDSFVDEALPHALFGKASRDAHSRFRRSLLCLQSMTSDRYVCDGDAVVLKVGAHEISRVSYRQYCQGFAIGIWENDALQAHSIEMLHTPATVKKRPRTDTKLPRFWLKQICGRCGCHGCGSLCAKRALRGLDNHSSVKILLSLEMNDVDATSGTWP